MHIAILHERQSQPDDYVAQVLESALTAQGCQVFIDRSQTDGIEWVREIKNQVRTADVVIVLLSGTSVSGETLAYEIRIAFETAQQQGKPKVLPIRLNFLDPLPRPLTGILPEPIIFSWMSPQDNLSLTQAVLSILNPAGPVVIPSDLTPQPLEPVGGAVPLNSKYYILRRMDEEFSTAISRGDSIVLVKGARQMGKTSLLARGLQQAREAGARVILTDFQKLNDAYFDSINTFFLMLAEMITDQLNLDIEPEKVWNTRRGPNMNFERFLRREVLGQIQTHLVWGLDEVDRLFSCDFGSEVFGLFRSWHNERSLDPTGPWQRLTLAIAYATEAHLFITDLNQSPFNVGTRLTLEDFTFDQVKELNQRYGRPLKDDAEVARYFRLVGGHPYLVRRGLYEMVVQAMTLSLFEAQADRDEGLFGDHLRRLLMSILQDEALTQGMKSVLQEKGCPHTESFYRLRSAGVILGDSGREVLPRCQLYSVYLKRHLL